MRVEPRPWAASAAAGASSRDRRSSQAAIGALLVVVAAVGVLSTHGAATAPARTTYAVARHDLAVGARIRPADVELVRMALPGRVRAGAFDQVDTLVGATIVATVRQGELVQRSDVVRRTTAGGGLQLWLPLPTELAASGQLRAGDTVELLATAGEGADATTTVIAPEARVVRVATGRDRRGSGLVVAVRSRSEALALAHAIATARLTVLRTTGAPRRPDDPVRHPPGAEPA